MINVGVRCHSSIICLHKCHLSFLQLLLIMLGLAGDLVQSTRNYYRFRKGEKWEYFQEFPVVVIVTPSFPSCPCRKQQERASSLAVCVPSSIVALQFCRSSENITVLQALKFRKAVSESSMQHCSEGQESGWESGTGRRSISQLLNKQKKPTTEKATKQNLTQKMLYQNEFLHQWSNNVRPVLGTARVPRSGSCFVLHKQDYLQ